MRTNWNLKKKTSNWEGNSASKEQDLKSLEIAIQEGLVI